MKIIDLLNKIANGEEPPKKIRLGRYLIMEYDGEEYIEQTNKKPFLYYIWNLNEKVEILEEEPRNIEVCGSLFTKSEYDKLARSEEEKKIPERLIPTSLKGIDNLDEKIEIAHIDTISAIETINEIIDYLKSKGEQ